MPKFVFELPDNWKCSQCPYCQDPEGCYFYECQFEVLHGDERFGKELGFANTDMLHPHWCPLNDADATMHDTELGGQMARRIAVTGGREFKNERLVYNTFVLVRLSGVRGDTIVHGGCRGCDLLCERVARRDFDAQTEEHKADWVTHGKAAGPIRNREMLKSRIDLLIAFPGGRGTQHCVDTARKLGIPVLEAR